MALLRVLSSTGASKSTAMLDTILLMVSNEKAIIDPIKAHGEKYN